MIINSILLFFIAVLASCGNTYFEESQPQGVKLRDKIPGKLHGDYRNMDDSSLLTINEKMILTYEKDKTAEDTLFAISDSTFITKHKKYFYINIRGAKNQWIVIPMQLSKKNLSFWLKTQLDSTYSDRDFVRVEKEFNSIDSSYATVYYLKPSKKELQNLHEEGVFQMESKYIKID